MVSMMAMMQAAAQAAQATAAATPSEVVPYFSSAIAIVKVQQKLKSLEAYQKFVTAFPGASKWAHWFIAAAGSMIAALGIGIVWDYDPNKGGLLTLQIPALAVLLHRLWDFTVVYLFQDFGYEATRRGPMPAPEAIVAAKKTERKVEAEEAAHA
jgi:hypothetical protein